jgi:hypothetical protein
MTYNSTYGREKPTLKEKSAPLHFLLTIFEAKHVNTSPLDFDTPRSPVS